MRQQQIYKIIKFNKPKTIVEVGTYNGIMAMHYITWALKFTDHVMYYGFDLFEDATEETDEAEFNGKVSDRASMIQVAHTLQSYKDREGLNFDFELIKGNSRETLAIDGPWKNADLAIIDGGHSIETIKSDYDNLINVRCKIFDDFYEPDEHGNCPDIEKVGCNFISKELPNAVMLPATDPVTGGGLVRMVLTPIQCNPFPVNFQVKTKNCVPDDIINSNIEYATRKPRKYLGAYKTNNATAVIVAAGPSYLEDLEEIRELSYDMDNYVFCVKSNYKKLLEAGVNVFGCTLLDPRSHVADFIPEVRDDIHYFVATMCDPSTIDHVENAKLTYFWNALVGAGEDVYITKLVEEQGRSISLDMVRGGSTSAMRTMSIAHLLGFRKIVLYGFDCCFWEPQNMDHVDNMGQPYFWNVSVENKPFLTSLQLFSQAQEFIQMISALQLMRSFDIEVRGRGIIKHIYDTKYPVYPTFEGLANG